jgi:DNA-binding NarL/FixJ family response regulator
MRVYDHGRGGAAIYAGTSLRGIARRLAAFDSTLTADSPPGGPTQTRIFRANTFEVVDDGPSLIRALTTHRPDVAVVDVQLLPTFADEGLRAVIDARKRTPALPVVVLSQYVEHLYARELMPDRAGAVGYPLKDRVMAVDQFIANVRQVAADSTVMDPGVVGASSPPLDSPPPAATAPTRTRATLPDGPGPHQRRRRQADVRQREDRQQTQLQQLHQTRRRSLRGRQPPDPGRTRLPGRLNQ